MTFGDNAPRPVGGDGQPYNEHELRDFREHQSKTWNPAYNGHRWLATIAARDAQIEDIRAACVEEHETAVEVLNASKARVAQLEAALRYYANHHNYDIQSGLVIMDDMGDVGDGTFALGATARAALKGTP